MGALSLKIIVAVIGISTSVLGVAGYLSYAKFAQTALSLTEARLFVSVREMRGAIATGLSIGLPLSMMSNVQAVLEREARKDPRIRGIAVFDEHGRELYGIGRRDHDALPDIAAGAPEWSATLTRAIVAGAELRDSLGLPAGRLALWYERESLDTLKRDFLTRLALGAAALVVFVTGAAALATLRIVGALAAPRESIVAHCRSALGRDVHVAETLRPAAGLDRDAASAVKSAVEVRRLIAARSADLRRLCTEE